MNMMRKNNNRNNHQRRGGGGGGQRRYNNSGGGNRPQNDGQNLQRQKHHATQQLGKYSDLARNAQINGDRVDVEYYLQHIDHYTRILADIAAIEAERHAHQRESQIVPGGPNDPNAQQGTDAAGDATASEGSEGTADAAPAGGGDQGEPRQQRPRYQRPDNGAREANSNTTEIPLPGSILPPI